MKGVQSVTAEEERTLITQISPQELFVSDFTGGLLFYRKGLRLALQKQEAGHAEFRVGGEPFILQGGADASVDPVTLHLIAKDLDRVRESVHAWRGRLLSGPQEVEEAGDRFLEAVFHDPDANRVVIRQKL